MKTLKKLTALLSAFALFTAMSADALAISRIPSAMQQTTEILKERSSEFQGTKNNTEVSVEEAESVSLELQRQYWEELFALEQKADEEKGHFLMELVTEINADDYDAEINLQVKAMVDVIKQKLEEKISGSVYFNDKSEYLDEPEDGKIQGEATIRIIGNDFYILLEDFITEGSAEEEMMIFDLLSGNWLHADMFEFLGEDFWSQSSNFDASDLNTTSVKDIEQVFAEMLMQESDLTEIQAYKVAKQFSLQKLFYISKSKTSGGQIIYSLELRKDRAKRAFLSTGEIIGDPLDDDDIEDMDKVLDKLDLTLSFYADAEENTFEAMRIVFSLKNVEDINSLYIKFSIDILDWDEDAKIRAPEKYTEVDEFMMNNVYYDSYYEGENDYDYVDDDFYELQDNPEAVIE